MRSDLHFSKLFTNSMTLPLWYEPRIAMMSKSSACSWHSFTKMPGVGSDGHGFHCSKNTVKSLMVWSTLTLAIILTLMSWENVKISPTKARTYTTVSTRYVVAVQYRRYIIVLAMNLLPGEIHHLVHPWCKFATKFFVEGSKKRDNLKHIKWQFSVEIQVFEYVDEIVN